MYNGRKGIIHKNIQKPRIIHNEKELAVYPGEGCSDTSDPIIVRGYDSLVIYGSYTGSSDEIEINVLPVDPDETTVLSTPIASFTLTTSLTNDNISIAKGRPGVAIQIINKSTVNTGIVTTKVVATWK